MVYTIVFISAIQQGESAMKVKVLVAQSCPTFASLPDSPDHGIFQARIVEWVPFPSQGDLPDSGIECWSPALRTDSLPSMPSCAYIYLLPLEPPSHPRSSWSTKLGSPCYTAASCLLSILYTIVYVC